MPHARAAHTLRETALFAGLTEPEIDSLAARVSVRTYAPGQRLFGEGDPCAGLYFVVSGRVRIFKTSPNGREQVLTVEGPGSSVAELPVFDGGPYPASADALEPSELLFVSRQDFHALCLERPQIALQVLQVVGSRLRRLVGIIEELSFSTVRARLISWILREAEAAGGTAFSMAITHQDLAARIGTVRELVSRNMARLQAQGLIRVQGREIQVLDRAGLESEISGPVT
ncbi:MAG: Crp/Fnr family transcriptional regulator [Bryobacteraceae bacterium]